jgi:selenocysteine-specific elongation factor
VTAEDAVERLRETAILKVVRLDGEGFFTTERKWNGLKAALIAALREFHSARPLEPGKDMEELREQLRPGATTRMFRAFVENLDTERAVTREGSVLRLPDHRVSLRPQEQQAAEQIRHLLARRPLAPPDLRHISQEIGIDDARLTQVLRVLERQQLVVRVSADLYLLRESIDEVARTLRNELTEGDEITPAMFRDRFNTTRKYAIPLLEYLDMAGVTVRIGSRRQLKAARSTVR